MAYTLQAIIAKNGVFDSSPVEGAVLVQLAQGFEMLPLTTDFRELHGIPFLPLTDEGSDTLPLTIKWFCTRLSIGRQIAYVEAEFFGGDGAQASAVFTNGKLEMNAVIDDTTINDALFALGVDKQSYHDEFDALGLDQHRNTDDWVEEKKCST